MNVTRYLAGDRRYVVVDAEHYVPERAAFAARHCDPEEGVAPSAGDAPSVEDAPSGADVPTQVHAEQGVRSPHDDSGDTVADGGALGSDDDSVVGADGVLFLALEAEFTPPRVVMTVVHPDGDRTPCCTRGVRCAARWVANRTDADRVMVDTQAGTREARVHDDGTVSVELVDASDGQMPDEGPTERGSVVREFTTEISRPTP